MSFGLLDAHESEHYARLARVSLCVSIPLM